MSYFAPNKALAERAAAHLNAAPRDPIQEASRPTVRYIVERYPTPSGRYVAEQLLKNMEGSFRFEWGVVRRWRYADRPDLGEFGGAFEVLTAEHWS